jgi:hypothetical protein
MSDKSDKIFADLDEKFKDTKTEKFVAFLKTGYEIVSGIIFTLAMIGFAGGIIGTIVCTIVVGFKHPVTEVFLGAAVIGFLYGILWGACCSEQGDDSGG